MFPRAIYKENQEDWGDVKDPVAMPKYDGANYFLQVDSKGEFHFYSRRPSVKGGFPDRTSQLPHLTSKPLPQFAGQVFNVELIHTGHSFSDTKQDHPTVSGILNSLPEKSIETQKQVGPVRAVLLNVVYPKINTFGKKLEHMKELEKAFDKPEILRTTYTKIGDRDIRELIDSSKKIDSEGVIITSLTSPEDSNIRHKIKFTNTWNLKIKGITQEYDISGSPKDSAGALIVADSTGKEVANVGTGLSKELRKEIWKNPKDWIGKVIQVKGRNPSRDRLLAPVYNGFSDGDIDRVGKMIKIAYNIEDQLLENLVAKYKAKGVNLQKILDNQLFQQLSLDKKIAFIEQVNSPILQKPKFSMGNIGVGLVGGGVGGVIATAMYGAMHGGWSPGTRAVGIGIGALAGSGFGGIGGAIRSYMDKSRDKSTRESALKGGLTALVDRSGSGPIVSSPFGMNQYLAKIEGYVDSMAGPIGHTAGISG